METVEGFSTCEAFVVATSRRGQGQTGEGVAEGALAV